MVSQAWVSVSEQPMPALFGAMPQTNDQIQYSNRPNWSVWSSKEIAEEEQHCKYPPLNV